MYVENIMEDREKGTGDYLSALDNDSCCLAPSTICHNVSLCHNLFTYFFVKLLSLVC